MSLEVHDREKFDEVQKACEASFEWVVKELPAEVLLSNGSAIRLMHTAMVLGARTAMHVLGVTNDPGHDELQ